MQLLSYNSIHSSERHVFTRMYRVVTQYSDNSITNMYRTYAISAVLALYCRFGLRIGILNRVISRSGYKSSYMANFMVQVNNFQSTLSTQQYCNVEFPFKLLDKDGNQK